MKKCTLVEIWLWWLVQVGHSALGSQWVFTLTGHTGYDRRNEHCCVVVEGNQIWTIIYWLIIIGPLVGCCDATMVFCNWKIYKKLKNHANAQTNNNNNRLKKNVVKDNREILLFMIIDMLMPICAHTVYHVCKSQSRLQSISNFFGFTSIFFTCLYLGNAAARGFIIIVMLQSKYIEMRSNVIFWEGSRIQWVEQQQQRVKQQQQIEEKWWIKNLVYHVQKEYLNFLRKV